MADPRMLTPAHLNELVHETHGILTDKRLLKWSNASAERTGLLQGLILGSISWSESLGKPNTKNLADAFAVEHTYCDLTVTAGKPEPDCKDPQSWRTGDPPLLTDAQPSENRYRVVFSARLQSLFPNKITVALRDRVGWQEAGPYASSRPLVVPNETTFQSGGEAVILEFSLVAPIHFNPDGPNLKP